MSDLHRPLAGMNRTTYVPILRAVPMYNNRFDSCNAERTADGQIRRYSQHTSWCLTTEFIATYLAVYLKIEISFQPKELPTVSAGSIHCVKPFFPGKGHHFDRISRYQPAGYLRITPHSDLLMISLVMCWAVVRFHLAFFEQPFAVHFFHAIFVPT